MATSRFLQSFVPTSMGKIRSSIATCLGRAIKIVMVVVLLPLAFGLFTGVLQQLETASFSGGTFREWASYGFVTYVVLHLLLYRPVPLFRVSHRLFSTLAVWLFGGQVASVETAGGSGKGKRAKDSKGKETKGEAGVQGSTLVAFSPYVIPLYTVLVCALGWVLARWMDRNLLDGPVSFFIGLTIAFHWVMTADDLQEQRDRWHLETYLLAIGLVFVVTLLIGGACLPWAIPEFSFVRALADGFSHAQAIYTTIVQRLFTV